MQRVKFSKQFKVSLEKLVMEAVFELNQDPLVYHAIYFNLYDFMEKSCPTSNYKNEAWERFLELVQEYQKTCEISSDTMRQRHSEEEPSNHLQKALNFAINERGGVWNEAGYQTLTETFALMIDDLKNGKLKPDGVDFHSLFHVLNIFSYTEFNPALQYVWRKFHGVENPNEKNEFPEKSTVGSFKEAYDLIQGEKKRCFLCNEFKRKQSFKYKYLVQHLNCFHSIYSYACDWDGCRETFAAWRYVLSHKNRFHEVAKSRRLQEENVDKENVRLPSKREHETAKTTGNPSNKRFAANQILEQEESCSDEKSNSTASSPNIINKAGTTMILNVDPKLMHPMCEKVINDLCAIIESYDSSVKVTTPFTYDANTGVLERKVQMQPKLQVPACPVLSSSEEYIPGLSYVQSEVELE